MPFWNPSSVDATCKSATAGTPAGGAASELGLDGIGAMVAGGSEGPAHGARARPAAMPSNGPSAGWCCEAGHVVACWATAGKPKADVATPNAKPHTRPNKDIYTGSPRALRRRPCETSNSTPKIALQVGSRAIIEDSRKEAAVQITLLTAHTGAEVRDVDLSQPVSDATKAALNLAFVEHSVLVIRD